MPERLYLEIDDADVRRMLEQGRLRLDKLVNEMAEELQRQVAKESDSASSRVAASWQIEGSGKTERKVVSDVFFAPFLARGTAGHGPRKAERMIFSIEGRTVSASFVQGIPADPFDEQAIKTTEARADDVLARLFAGL